MIYVGNLITIYVVDLILIYGLCREHSFAKGFGKIWVGREFSSWALQVSLSISLFVI